MTDIYVFFGKREKYNSVYDLLGGAFEKLYGKALPRIIKDENGKPHFAESCGVHFSLSHSGEYFMCALSEKNVGADIQKKQPVSDNMKKRVFSERELEFADEMSLWCLKESFIKLVGKLDREYKNIEFLKRNDVFCGPDDVRGVILNEISDYAAAVCAEHIENVCVSML